MAQADELEVRRAGPWVRVAALIELVLVTGLLTWTDQLTARAVGLGASRGVEGTSFLAWAALDTPFTLAIVLCALRLRGARPASIGLARPASGWARAILVGLMWGAGLFAISWGLAHLRSILGLVHDARYFSVVSTRSWLTWIAGALLAGAFGEELYYRGYLLERVERVLGGLVPAAWATRAAVAAGALLFGWRHAYQGPMAVVAVTVTGLGLGAAFLRSGRNLVVPVVAHAVLDVVALTQLHLSS